MLLRRVCGLAVIAVSFAACGGEEFSGAGGSSGSAGSAASGGSGGSAGSAGGAAGSAGVGGAAGAGQGGVGGGGSGGAAGAGGIGGCESYCGAHGTCEGAICTLAIGLSGAENPVADADYIYWSDYFQLMKASKNGSEPAAALIDDAGSNFEYVAIDATHVYATDDEQNRLVRIDKFGNNLAVLAASLHTPQGVAVDDTFVYFADAGLGKVMRIDKNNPTTGSSPTVMASATGPDTVVLDATHLYWVEDTGVYRCEKSAAPCAPETVSTKFAPDNEPHLVVNPTHAFWTTPNGVASVVKDGQGVATAIASGFGPISGLFVGSHAYFCTPGEGAVHRAALDGGQTDLVVGSELEPRGVWVDDAFVYWLTDPPDNGKLRKMPLPF